LRFGSGLSGDTPGDHAKLSTHRGSVATRCADQLPPGQTRWSSPLPPTVPKPVLVNALARSFLGGETSVEGIVERAARTLGRNWRWLRPVARHFVERFGGQVRPTRRTVSTFIIQDPTFHRAWTNRATTLTIAEWAAGTGGMQPVAAAVDWPIPQIPSAGELARWLQLSASELQWLADLKGFGARSRIAQVQNYHYRILTKPTGNLRLIEAPKHKVKMAQRQVLREILDRIPIHHCVHGFVKARSIRTFAAEHVGKRVVLRMDLSDFFPSIGRHRIQALFRTAGYPELVANLLGGICTNATPRSFWNPLASGRISLSAAEAIAEARQLYLRPHLPQGAPTSPALANICAYRLDCRLTGLAGSAGAHYTRYADDLAFSGDSEFNRRVERFANHVSAVVIEEGWSVNHRKTRIMRQSVRQHLVGLVSNQRLNVAREDFDRLKAILTNCLRHGWQSQNREAHRDFRSHLDGRVTFVESINDGKGKRLRKLFDRIEW